MSSEVEKLFRAFAEERKRELPRFTPDGIHITLENKFDDAIYNYLYAYWKEQSGEYDPKKDVIPESEMNKMHPKTKNEKKFEQWLLQQYGMTKKEQRGYTLEGNLDSLWEIFSAADMVLLARGLPSIGKELAQLGKKAVDDVAEEAIEKTVKKEAAEEMAESTAKKEATDTAEDLSQKTVDKDDILESNDAGISFKDIPDGDDILNYSSLMHALRKSNSIEGNVVAKLLKRNKINVIIAEKFSDGRGGAYFPHSRNIYIYRKLKLPSGEWVLQSPSSAAGFLAHETKHWIDGGVKIKMDEVNAYMWQKKVDLNLKYTIDDIWEILNTHQAYKHLKN